MWDKDNQTISHLLRILRGVSVIAGGSFDSSKANEESITFNVTAKDGEEWVIVQSPFMKKNAKTIEFTQELSVNSNELNYTQTMVLDIYGRIFNHKDVNKLRKA